MDKAIENILQSKSELSRMLFLHFIHEFEKLGEIKVEATKTMIGISNSHKRIVWITAIGKNFVHVVFPFKQAFDDNLCFQKIAQVPGDNKQFNHHLRILAKDDVNEEVIGFMKKAYEG